MKKTAIILLVLLLSLSSFIFTSCGNNDENDYLFQITDFDGNVIGFDKTADKVIAFGPADTSILIALGAVEKIAAKSKWDNFSELEDKNLPEFDSYNLNAEIIISIMPDVIFTLPNGSSTDVLNQLKGFGIKIVVLNAESVNDIYRKIDIISKITGTESEGVLLKNRIQNELTEVKNSVAAENKKSVYVELDSWDGLYTCGLKSFVNEILDYAGCVNALESIMRENNINDAWVNISSEQVILSNPYAIIFSDYGYTEIMIEEIKTRQGFGNVDAVTNNRIYGIDASLLSQAGADIAVLAKAINGCIYGNN